MNVHFPTFLHPLPFFVPACQSRLLAGVGGGHREQMGHGRGQNEGEQTERLKNVKRCAEGTACPSKVLNWLWKELVEWFPCPPKYSPVLWCPPSDIKEEKEDTLADLKTESHFLARVHDVIVGYKTLLDLLHWNPAWVHMHSYTVELWISHFKQCLCISSFSKHVRLLNICNFRAKQLTNRKPLLKVVNNSFINDM